ncbi:MAG: hypothetical protein IT374_07980 [Polyangiaceae bacterium]|nr:hypothetical protein [Polyangiaceae bacterium]
MSGSAAGDDFPEATGEAQAPLREPLVLTADEQRRGMGECATPDPGRGDYGDPGTLPGGGHIVIPRSGGHDDSLGFDVVLHFHGFPAMRKSVVRARTGVVLAGYDWGTGSGAYEARAEPGRMFEALTTDVTRALRAHTGDERAHVRHLALSGWSAGYGAVSALLRKGDSGVDAVVLLDGFHASYGPGARGDRVDTTAHAAIVAFAERAAHGEKTFYFTHSAIQTTGYASTTEVAALLASRLGVTLTQAEGTDDPLGLRAFADVRGFHLRSFKGDDKRAHCDHLRHATAAIRDVLVPAWQTPAPG